MRLRTTRLGVTSAGRSAVSLDRQIAALFEQGEQGAWYDIAPQYCFQDTAGTTPALVGDPVGRVTDLSGNGNHASQTTATSRPILRQNGATGAYYLEFDGADDFLVTNAINFTATDKMTVWAGVRKLADGAYGCVVRNLSPGRFGIFAPGTVAGSHYFYVVGSIGTAGDLTTLGLPAPVTTVLVGLYNLAGAAIADKVKARINGAPTGGAYVGDGGSGVFGDSALYIGRREGILHPFNGHLYGLLVRGAQSNDSQIKIVERYLAQKTGVTLA